MKKNLKKYRKTKYAGGTQLITGGTDPTTLYNSNRKDTVADTQFNNAQQDILNKGLIQQQTQDKTNQVLDAYGNAQAGKSANTATASSALSAMGPMGQLAAVGYGLGTSTGGKFDQAAYENTAKTGKADRGNQLAASVFTPTSSKLMNSKSGADVVNAFVPFLNTNNTTSAKQAKAAYAANQRQTYVNNQLNQFGAVDDTVQSKQLKKGSRKINARVIESEGREPVFSPKDSSGNRKLLYHNPEDPTHKQGGVKMAVVKGKEKIRGLLTIPENSAIVTANDGMNTKALKAYKRGDQKTLNKIINKMPEDNISKKAGGSSSLNSNKWNTQTDETIIDTGNSANKWGGNVYNDLSVDPTLSQSIAPTKTYNNSKLMNSLGNAGTGLMQAAPSIYNLGRGLLEKPKMTNRRYIANEGYKYKNLSQPAVNAANEQFRVDSNNIRNATGGAGGTYLSNQAMASANRFKNISDINNQEAGKRLDIKNMNTGLKNQQNAQNMQLANQYDDLDSQNLARKNDFIGAGLTGLSDLSFNRQAMKNQANADKIRATTLETNNYKYDTDNWKRTFKQRKGNKSVKIKKK